MDDQSAILDAEFFARLGDSTEIFLDQSSDRQGFISSQLDLEKVIHFPHLSPPMDQDLALSDTLNEFFRDIRFVDNLTDHLFEEILKSHEPHDTAELVYDNAHVSFFLLKLLHQIIGRLPGWNKERRMGNISQP